MLQSISHKITSLGYNGCISLKNFENFIVFHQSQVFSLEVFFNLLYLFLIKISLLKNNYII